jgi:hypothetical protein
MDVGVAIGDFDNDLRRNMRAFTPLAWLSSTSSSAAVAVEAIYLLPTSMAELPAPVVSCVYIAA